MQARGTLDNSQITELIEWIEGCDELIKNQPEDNLYENIVENVDIDYLLIGSKALKMHWDQNLELAEESLKTCTSWKGTALKNWADERFNRDSDWDLICLNKSALVRLLKSGNYENIALNYIVHVEDFEPSWTHQFWEWFEEGCIPKKWIEFAVRLEQLDGEVIEIEYCTNTNQLLKYLNSINVDKCTINLPSSLKSQQSTFGVATIQLLEILKLSHLQFNTNDNNWIKHILDIELIHLIQKKDDRFYEDCFENAYSSNNLPEMVFYDRITKRIFKYCKDTQDDDYDTNLDMFLSHRNKDEVYQIIRPVNGDLLNPFNKSIMYINLNYLGNDSQSREYISQNVAAYLIGQMNHFVNSKELETLVFQAVRVALDFNFDNIMYEVIRNNFMEISELVFNILNKPDVLKALFETKIDMQIFRFVNTPIDFVNDQVTDISNMEGLKLYSQYFPIEIIMNILSFISRAIDIVNFTKLNKTWNDSFRSQDVWKYLYFSRYPTPSYCMERPNLIVENWKQSVLMRSRFDRVHFPTENTLENLFNAFKSKFISKSTIFKQFISDFFRNTYTTNVTFKEDKLNEYTYLNATILIYWPRQPPIKIEVKIEIDWASYRSGDSKGWLPRNRINGILSTDKSTKACRFSTPLKDVIMEDPENYIGKYFLEQLERSQVAPLFTTLVVLGFGNKGIREVFGSSWC